ncbi:chaperone HtpG [Bacteroides pyogenes]|nr:chaperone HtpG [Bacteroides pyogenes]
MFKDLGQFKAYIRNIDNFDQLYIIQQGGREVTKEQIVAQLERAIAKDAESVLFENRVIWQSLGINSSADLERFCQARRLSQHAAFQSFRNCILITK